MFKYFCKDSNKWEKYKKKTFFIIFCTDKLSAAKWW